MTVSICAMTASGGVTSPERYLLTTERSLPMAAAIASSVMPDIFMNSCSFMTAKCIGCTVHVKSERVDAGMAWNRGRRALPVE